MVVTVGFLRRLCENRNIFPCFHSFSYHCAAVVLLAMKMSKHTGPSAYNAGYSETAGTVFTRSIAPWHPPPPWDDGIYPLP